MRWILLVLPVLAACVGVRTLEGERIPAGSPAFPAYVERVFREQNRLLDELAFRLADNGLDRTQVGVLEQSEAALIRECAALNRLAAARRDGRRLGRLESLRLARQAPGCEAASVRAADALAASEG